MVLTRATDNRLKTFFTGGEVKLRRRVVPGQGIPIARPGSDLRGGIRLRRGAAYRGADGRWSGDVIGPVIRDLGVALAMRPEPSTVRMVLNAQMGKAGPPLDGKDLHIGDFDWGILPPAAPLTTATLTIAGMAMAFWRDGSGRVARLVHRRGRIVARRVARGDQPVRRAAAAGDLLRREQPDGALDAGRRTVGRPRVRRQGRRLRHPRDHASTAPIPDGSPRRSPGRPSARAPGRARRSSRRCRCGCAATRTTTTCSTSAAIRRRRGTTRRSRSRATRTASSTTYWAARDPIAALRGAAAGGGHPRGGRPRSLQARGRGDGRGGGARGHRCAVAGAGAGGRRRVRERAAARARRGPRSGDGWPR